MITRGQAGDTRADRRHDARALVPQHDGNRVRPLPQDNMEVGVADPGRGYGHLDLAGPRRGEFHLGDLDRLPGPAENRGPHPATRPAGTAG